MNQEAKNQSSTNEHPSGVYPVEDYILVIQDEVKDYVEAPGGTKIYLADDSEKNRRKQAKQVKGTIVSTGPEAFRHWSVEPKVGHRILMQEYAGRWVEGKDGKEYRLLIAKDVEALIDF